MENALLVGLSQQTALRRQMDVIANNLANMSTAGFKSEMPVFEDFVMPLASAEGFAGEAADIHYVHDRSLFRDYADGPLEQTGNVLDMSISGEGWFVLEGPDGELFTRNGHFSINDEGLVVTSEGLPVLTAEGPITIKPGDTEITVSKDGTITTSLGAKGKLQVVEFEDERALKKLAAGAYSAEDLDFEPAADYRINQGALEGSNVNSIKEITSMIAVTRAYTSAAQVLDTTNTLRRSAIEKLGQAPN